MNIKKTSEPLVRTFFYVRMYQILTTLPVFQASVVA